MLQRGSERGIQEVKTTRDSERVGLGVMVTCRGMGDAVFSDEVRGMWHVNKFVKLLQRKETAIRPHHSCGSVISVSSPIGDATVRCGMVLPVIGSSGPVEGMVEALTGSGSGPEGAQKVASEA